MWNFSEGSHHIHPVMALFLGRGSHDIDLPITTLGLVCRSYAPWVWVPRLVCAWSLVDSTVDCSIQSFPVQSPCFHFLYDAVSRNFFVLNAYLWDRQLNHGEHSGGRREQQQMPFRKEKGVEVGDPPGWNSKWKFSFHSLGEEGKRFM